MANQRGKVVYESRNCQVRFRMDRQGMRKIAMDDDLREAVLKLADEVAKPWAIKLSPRSTEAEPGHVHYQDSFVVAPSTATIAAMRRVAARLWNIAPHAAAVEFGTEFTEGHHVLGKTLDRLNFLGRHHN